MNRRLGPLAWIVGLTIGVSACSGADDAGGKKTINRNTGAPSEFQPSELEKTVDTLVAEIGKTTAIDLQVAELRNADDVIGSHRGREQSPGKSFR